MSLWAMVVSDRRCHMLMRSDQLEIFWSVCQARDIEGGLAGGLIRLLVRPYSCHHMDTFEPVPFV